MGVGRDGVVAGCATSGCPTSPVRTLEMTVTPSEEEPATIVMHGLPEDGIGPPFGLVLDNKPKPLLKTAACCGNSKVVHGGQR